MSERSSCEWASGSRSGLALVLLAIFALGTAQRGLAAKAGLPVSDSWIEATTQNFRLVSNASERKTREIGSRLERFRQVLIRLKPGQDFVAPVPLRIYVFKSDDSFAPYKQGKTQGEGLLGFFLNHAHGQYIAINAYPREYDVLPVIYHEYVHFYVRTNFPRLPLWANEGLAEYYSTFQEFPSDVSIGSPIVHHVHYLREHSFLPFERLFTVGVDSPEYSETEKKGAFYAQSWALMHFLMSGQGPAPSETNLFLHLLGQGEGPAVACEKGLRLTLPQLEAKLRGYVNQRFFSTMKVRLDELPEPLQANVVPLAVEQALFYLGDLLVHSADSDQRLSLAEEHFREALARRPSYGDPWAGRAFVAAERGEHHQAEQLAAKAIELGASSPQALLLFAEIQLRELREAGPVTADGIAGERHLKARAALERLLAGAPEFAEARALLGETYFYDRDGAEKGIAELTRASRELPDRADIVFNLAMLTLKSGDIQAARRIVDGPLSRFGKPDWVERAREAVNRSELIGAANNASSAGDDHQALELMRKAREAATAPEVRAALERQLADLEALVRHNDQVREYNSAVEKANRGAYAEALAALKAMMPEIEDEELRESVTHLIGELEELAAPR